MDNSRKIAESEKKPKTLADYQRKIMEAQLEPIAEYLKDPTVNEVMINGPSEIFIERSGVLEKTDSRFEGAAALEAAARAILQFVSRRRVDGEYSYEARLQDGSRVHIVYPPAAVPGVCIAIRKFSSTRLTLEDLRKEKRAFTSEMEGFLREAVSKRKNIIVSGGTGSGKTTLVNALSECFKKTDRIILIEDVAELQLDPNLHVVPFEVTPPDKYGRGGIDVRGLFKASLRMRPDRVIVGECRGGEAMDMVQAMNSGHAGSLSTVHANTPRDAMRRLESLCLMSDVDIPLSALGAQLCSAIDYVVQAVREGPDRYISEVASVSADESHRYDVRPIFQYKP